MDFKKLYLLLYKYLRLQNTRFISVFEYILEVGKEFKEIDNVTFYLKSNDSLIKSNIFGNNNEKDLKYEYEAIENTEFLYIDNDKKYIFTHNIGDVYAKTEKISKKLNYNKIIIPIYIEQKENETIKIGAITLIGKNLTLEKTKNRIVNIRDTMIFLGTIFSSISQMMYNRFDKLTSLITRKEFEFELNELLLKKPKTISVIMLDIDHFKKINDTYGHDAGDLVLRQFSQRILTQIRTTDRKNNSRDIAVRWGGEEFIIILPNTNLTMAKKIAERIKENIISKTYYINQELEINVTSSLGIANSDMINNIKITEDNILKLITLADSALYDAKHNGRNIICVYEENKKQQKLELK